MKPVTYNMSMVRGDTFSFTVEDTLHRDVTGVTFSIKRRAADAEPVVCKTVGDGVTRLEDGRWLVRVAPEDTRGVSAGRYVYDVQLAFGADIWTVMMGVMMMIQDVTDN